MTLSAMVGLGKAAKGSEGELEGAGGVGGLSGKGVPEWEGVPKAGGGAGLELCSGRQIPKVAWRGRLAEWIKCPVDA